MAPLFHLINAHIERRSTLCTCCSVKDGIDDILLVCRKVGHNTNVPSPLVHSLDKNITEDRLIIQEMEEEKLVFLNQLDCLRNFLGESDIN